MVPHVPGPLLHQGALSELFRVMNETDFRPELRTIRTPTLILQGEIDKSTPLNYMAALPTNSSPAARSSCAGMRHTACPTRTRSACWRIIAFAGAQKTGPGLARPRHNWCPGQATP